MESPPPTESRDGDGEVTVGVDALTEDVPDQSGGGAPKQIPTTSDTSDSENATPPSEPYHPLLPDVDQPKMQQNESSAAKNEKSPETLSPKKSRRVSFPMDARVVSGYMDPPNPWRDAASCTTEELVAAYMAACEKHNVKPMPKLRNQLMAISDFCDRNETFTLKGEKLDGKHCETLEEVLRRVQFRTIDIENTHLDDECAVAIFDMVEYYESCTKLNISYNKNIGVRGWQSCARLLKKTPCIDCLDARNCALTEQVMPMLGRSLRMGSQLKILHLENAILSGRPLMILVTAIKMNEILRELYLADNKLMPSDGIQLGNMLKYNHKLQLLDIRNNHLQDVGTSHLCDGLYEQNLGQGLNTLVLWNNQVTYQSMPALAHALVNTYSLETLNLGHNNVTNEGIHRLKEGLLHNKSLLRIGLQAAKISCEGAVALAEFIADSPRLLRVDLRENDIKTGGLMALSLSLKISQTVTRIDIDKDPKKESGVKDYADQQRRLIQDIQNLMIRNRDLTRQRELDAEREQEAEAEAAQKELQEAESRLPQVDDETEPEVMEEKPISPEVTPETTAAKAADDLADEGAAAMAGTLIVEQVEEEEVSELEEKALEAEAEPTRPEIRQLSLELPSRIQTLESPGFMTEAQLPILSPPTEAQVAEEVAALTAAVATEDVPVEFPPSPMTSQPKSLLSEISKGTLAEANNQMNSSPNNRRKFIISKVIEEAGPSMAVSTPQETGEEDSSSSAAEEQGAQASPVTSVAETNPAEASPAEAAGAGTEEPTQTNDVVSQDIDNSAANPETALPSETQTEESSSSAENPGGSESTADDVNGASGEASIEETNGTASGGGGGGGSGVGSESGGGGTDAAPEEVDVQLSNDCLPSSEHKEAEREAESIMGIAASPGGDSVSPDFHTNFTMNGMKVELAQVLDTLDKSDLASKASAEQKKVAEAAD